MSQYLCPECSTDSMVIETRPSYNRLRRRRKCRNGHRFSTVEVPLEAPEQIVELMTFAIENQHDMDDDMIAYVKERAREIILGLTEEET